ncbi:MAG: IclR family transcriptional regulator [Xanthobacteraceae bacterium]
MPNGVSKTTPHGSGYKVLAVLRQFAREAPDLGVTDLSGLTGMDKTSIFRALKALEHYRFVEQDPATRKYRLGYAVVELAGKKLKQMPLASIAQPHLAKLSRETGETVQMSVLDEFRVLYISVIESPQPIRVALGVGSHGPLHCTAAGKILLANAPLSDRERILSQPLKRFSPRTIVDPLKLRKELSDIRDRGWSTDDEGFVEHLRVAGAPVRDATDRVIAAVAVGGPTIRVSRRHLEKFVTLVVKTASSISKDLAHPI